MAGDDEIFVEILEKANEGVRQEIRDGNEKLLTTLTEISDKKNDVMIQAIKDIPAPNVEVSAPDVQIPEIPAPVVNVKAPIIPEIKVPKPEVIVNVKAPIVNVEPPKVVVPEIKIPDFNIAMPELMPIVGDVGLRDVNSRNPLPVIILGSDGKPMLFPASGGAGRRNVQLIGSGGQPVGVDATTDAIETIDYPHHEIHAGSHYYVEGCATLANGAELRVKLVTPDTARRAHFTWGIVSSGIMTTQFFEDASGGMAGGVGVTPLNNDRNSPNTSILTITSGVAVATDSGLKIGEACWGSRNVPGATNREDELLLKQNTTYLRKFISGSADNKISFKASWYEHTSKNLA